jgi:hypothetical protein
MSGVPRRPRRHSTVRVTGPVGIPRQGDGETRALAMRDLRRRHRAGEGDPSRGESRWLVTALGEAYLAGLRDGAAGGGGG